MYESQKTKATGSVKSTYHQAYMKDAEHRKARSAAMRKWRQEHAEEYKKHYELYQNTRKYASSHIPGGIPKGYCLHHAFGTNTHTNFLMLPIELHKALHSRFGRNNDSCLWNPQVEEFLKASGKPFYVFYNGRVTVCSYDLF